MTAYALFVVVQDTATWYQPQYAIPLMGMVLGNSLNGTSIGLNSFTDTLVTHREQVEMALTLGASRWEAVRMPVQHAVRTGMIPIINTMMVVGIVSLPGMMTGQLLSGTSPMCGREVPDRDHVSHRVGDSALHGRCRAVELLSVVQFRAPVSLPTNQRLKARKTVG